jgi:hypothetical protein
LEKGKRSKVNDDGEESILYFWSAVKATSDRRKDAVKEDWKGVMIGSINSTLGKK